MNEQQQPAPSVPGEWKLAPFEPDDENVPEDQPQLPQQSGVFIG